MFTVKTRNEMNFRYAVILRNLRSAVSYVHKQFKLPETIQPNSGGYKYKMSIPQQALRN